MSIERRAVWWVVASACSYSLFTVFSTWALEDLRPTDVLFWRFAIAAPVAWFLVALRRGRNSGGSSPMSPFVVAGAVFAVVALLAFLALDHISAALYTVIIYTYPAMVAAGSAVLGRRPPRRVWIAIGVTLVGVACTVPEVFRRPDTDVAGLVFTLANAVVYAAYVLGTGRLFARTDRPQPDGLTASACSFLGAFVVAAALVPVVGLRTPADAGAWSGLIGLGVVSTVIGGATLFLGMRRLPPTTAALVATLEPVLTLVWAVVLLDESLVVMQLVGAALVIAGVLSAQRAAGGGARAVPHRADELGRS